MKPITPSPRRSLLQSLGDLHGTGSNSNFDREGPSLIIPLPPLYYKKRDDTDDNKGTIDAFSYTYKTPEKKRGIPTLSVGKGSAFVPIERAQLFRGSGTPPLSPLVAKQLNYASPSPSMGSLAPTEDITEGSSTPGTTTPGPSPTADYLVVASSPIPTPQPQSPLALASPLSQMRSPSTFTRPTPPFKSPKKYHRESPVPCSPGNSSIGSNSTDEKSSRKQRLKTELCMHWTSGRECPFRELCTYAHGENELQITKLLDFQSAGLIEDAQTYRTKPCWTWVATGSCPFGKRCSCLHDPRVAGGPNSFISWLPHTETQGNSMTTDVNVDGLHQKRLSTILYDNPFGGHHSLELDEFSDLYELICNISFNVKRRRTSGISEAHKIAIALKMRECHTWTYKYRPQHVIYGEPCMVLEKRAFQLEKSGRVHSIPISQFNPKNKQHAMVREIAFGPDSDTTVRGVALWFNIPDWEVSACTPYQARRFRWKKKPKVDDDPRRPRKPSSLDTRECFFMIRPSDQDAFDFATKILIHRYETLLAERFLTSLSERSVALDALAGEEKALEDIYRNQKLSWIQWAWPINEGRRIINRHTPVPPVDGTYEVTLDQEGLMAKINAAPCEGAQRIKHFFTQPIWETFVSSCFEDPRPPESPRRRRLEPFLKLERGEEITSDRTSPHITNSYMGETGTAKQGGAKLAPLSRQSEICWKALLLKQGARNQMQNEWDMVLEHFQNSRSKTILAIIQN